MNKHPLYIGIDLPATGENISRLRIEKGLTVRDIQEIMGFDMPQAIYKWERGESLPSLEHLKVLSEVLCVNIDDIIVWSRPP